MGDFLVDQGNWGFKTEKFYLLSFQSHWKGKLSANEGSIPFSPCLLVKTKALFQPGTEACDTLFQDSMHVLCSSVRFLSWSVTAIETATALTCALSPSAVTRTCSSTLRVTLVVRTEVMWAVSRWEWISTATEPQRQILDFFCCSYKKRSLCWKLPGRLFGPAVQTLM